MASNLSGLLFKEIEEGRQKEKAGNDKEEKEANLSWRHMSADDAPGDGQHFSTTKFQNELRQSRYLNDNNASPSDNMRGRSNLRSNGNLYYEQMDRNQQSSDGCVESGELSPKTDGCRGINVGTQQWMKMDIVSHPMDECTAGFQEEEMRKKLKMDPSELLVYLQTKLEGFTTLLKRKLSPNMIMLVVEILAKITTASNKQLQASLLAHSIHSSVLEQFSTFSFNIIAQNMEFSAEEFTNYFENLYILYNTFVQMMPAKASEILSDHCTRAVMALQNLKFIRKLPVAPKLEEDYRSLMDHVESLNELHESVAQKRRREKVKREWQPGINFRELSVIPLPQDLSLKMKVDLCPAVIDGPYKSVEHYLDVQFNLMREDFIIPLREGIMNFIDHQSSKSNKYKRIENVRFYRGVRFLNHSFEGNSLVTEVLFNPRAKSSRHNWSRSKRFLFGTLLCFSSDLFSSIILGLVVDRRVELLEKGILRCELVGDVNKGELFEKEFIMAESEVYFEAYQHVLKALQNFTEENFPLKEYLIDVSPDSHYPTYLEQLPDTIFRLNGIEFKVLNKDSWPSKEEMELNESQYKALHSALTKKCAVIQGPPGTGKTYLGLKIAEVLLENTRKSQRGPILVVCYTNHALDQFLEGILSFTRNIVRIGSQSKNEKLNEFNLRVVSKEKWPDKLPFTEILIKIKEITQYNLFREILSEIKECTRYIDHCSQIVNKLMKNAGIISVKYLGYAVKKIRGAPYSAFSSWRDSSLKEWLFEGIYVQNSTNLDLDDIEPVTNDDEDFHLCTPYDIKKIITQLQYEASKAEGHELDSIRNEMMMWASRLQFLKAKLSEPYKPDMNLIQRLIRIVNIDSLEPQHRWALYRYWVSESVKFFQELVERARRYFQKLNCKKSEILQKLHLDILSGSDVIGMTTTGAARHQGLLQKVGPRIVIVEEAAEVMESHILACLSSQCEHLILIGDHKQLRPSPAVYRLAKDYHLEVSLFERLLMNGIRFDTLRIQHRMRPEIADLVFPAVYPLLENHPSVLAYKKIVGLKKNLFFITHTNPEETAMDDLSKKNTHEAEFLIALCRYIIMQGYHPSQITILTSYLGQMYLLNEERDKHCSIKNVRTAVVDNFQGEENDIILLSLVRNNEEGKIGFLASENRTCVALSRAKKGLYIIGNLDMLADKSSLWSKIREVLLEKEAVGTHLTLQCHKHPDKLTEVSKAEDFDDIPEGGGMLKCNKVVEKKLPNCDHKVEVKWCEVIDNRTCTEKCMRIMRCGHSCPGVCGIPCDEKSCEILTNRTAIASCGHEVRLFCKETSLDPHPVELMLRCKELCGKILECGHKCKGTCVQCMQGRIHITCPENCEKKLLCGHKCTAPCSQPCPPCKEQCHFRCDHSQCKNNCGKCSPCQKKCGWSCEHQTCNKNCSDFCDRPPCNEPCTRKLGCGHECIGFCGERCPNLCRVCHPKEVEDALVSLNATGDKNSRFIMLPDCGHVFESTSLEKSLCMTAHVVKLLACPLCHVPIQRAYRYKTAAKNHWNRVMQVKQMVTGNPRQVSKKVEKLAVKLCNLMDVEDFQKSRSFIDKLKQFLRSNKKAHFGASILYSLEARIEFALSVVEHYRELCTAIVAGESLLKCNEEANSLIHIFLGRLNNVTPQEYGDYQGECMRFHIMMELRALEGSEEFKAAKGGHWQLEYEQCCEFVAESCRFSEDKYLEMHRKINASGYLQLPSSVVKPRGFGCDLHMGCWYECPNNHFFAVGECISQDKQTVRCDQCNVAIIEGSHRLISGNNVLS
ncbi:NFX1-type zinc finger-containing protein 1-like [Ischnura elegans]|uniref:NFX1-type zinc finger-containing protein 1-like n=1 Tax=Ischnura elegans TaxID=197161 RepID=UPI001ED86A9E|nr:NFX1-type zinc finger-containing protein 1-like [Ischnura elegans]XP_046388079.1 NFX1-type zinc finger-containing protein 1-like [Ischnura elegans]